MAKRFMDNSIFEKQWFRKLPLRLKMVWFYLINKCNHAGIWECDVELLSFQIGEKYTLQEILEAFGDNIVRIDFDKYYITKFIEFQYGLPLNPNVKVHQSVLKILKKYNIESFIDSDMRNPLKTLKDNNKDKSMNIDTKKLNFANRVEKEVLDMNVNPKTIQDFIGYWTEHNTDGKILRYEQQDIFNIKRRMSTWLRNEEKFNKNNMTFQPADIDLEKKEARIEADYKEQQKRFKESGKDIASDEDRKKALGIN